MWTGWLSGAARDAGTAAACPARARLTHCRPRAIYRRTARQSHRSSATSAQPRHPAPARQTTHKTTHVADHPRRVAVHPSHDNDVVHDDVAKSLTATQEVRDRPAADTAEMMHNQEAVLTQTDRATRRVRQRLFSCIETSRATNSQQIEVTG